MRIRELLNQRNRALFVGRDSAIDAMRQHISSSEWKILHFHGPGGIGKTTLLRQFAADLPDGSCLYVDDHTPLPGILNPSGQRNAAGEEDRLDRIIDSLQEQAERAGSLVMLPDGFEPWSPAADWMRERLLPRLRTENIRIITAGRHPLQGRWQENGWQLLVSNRILPPLEPADIRRCAAGRGIVKADTVEKLVRFSKGVPLAMSLASELILRNGESDFPQPVEQHALISTLAGRLMREIAGTPLERYAEAASVVLKFDQELLQAMLGEAISTERFREFCDMPFVVMLQDRWALHDAVREWIATDFGNRKPQARQEIRRNALTALRARSALHPSLQSEIGFELIFLHDSPFVRGFCFQPESRLEFRAVGAGHLDRMERLYISHLQANCNADPADPHLAPLIRPLWRLQPDAFLGLWLGDELIAFISCLRLDDDARELLGSHPITQRLLSSIRTDEPVSVMCLYGAEPETEPLVNGNMVQAFPRLLQDRAKYINLLPPMEWEAYLNALGYERIPEADYVSSGGTPFRAYLIDLTTENLFTKIERILTNLAGQGEPPAWAGTERAVPPLPGPDGMASGSPAESPAGTAAAEPDASFQDTLDRISRFLKRYHKLPQYPEYVRDFLPLLPPEARALHDESAVQALMARTREILDRLGTGNPEEQRAGRILRYAYIQKVGTHEAAAEFLDIPVPSYYRYLKAAVRRFTFEWINHP